MTIMQGPIRVTDRSDAVDSQTGEPVYRLNNVRRSTTTTELRQQMESIIHNLKADGSIPNDYVITDIWRHADTMSRTVKDEFDKGVIVDSIIPRIFELSRQVNFTVTLSPPSGGRKSRRKRKTRRFKR